MLCLDFRVTLRVLRLPLLQTETLYPGPGFPNTSENPKLFRGITVIGKVSANFKRLTLYLHFLVEYQILKRKFPFSDLPFKYLITLTVVR